ncbi:MAG: hypothetical protein JXB10_18010 [Pirellulales bacterium]|nr:hypothetical protein [Pirellulales bacterium]
MNPGRYLLPVAVLLFPGILSPLRGEVFLLTQGGRVEGEWINREERPRRNYVVRVDGGARITIPMNRMLRVLPDLAEAEYEKIRPRYPDTVTGQWALAEWCREHHLAAQRETHLQRIIELEPDHAEARRLLGYTKAGGQWATHEDRMRKRGYEMYKGRWMLPQQIELLKAKEKKDAAQQEWLLKIRRWRNWLGTDRDGEARQAITEIRDPAALKSLVSGLRDEGLADVRLLYVEALAKIDVPEAAWALAVAAIDDPNREVRLTCLDHLQAKPHPEVVKHFVKKLKSRNISNETVNRIGVALGRMKDPSTILPLIDALVTSHRFRIPGGGAPGGMNAAFGKGPGVGGGGLAVGGGPKFVTKQFSNQAVLDALIAITGQNFSFDQHAWRTWFAAQRKSAPQPGIRRD